jgi:hypothetical protein
VAPQLDFWQKYVKVRKMLFFEVLSEVQKDTKDNSASKDIHKKMKYLIDFRAI